MGKIDTLADGGLLILHEDGHLIAIGKPAGILVHPTARGGHSLVDILQRHTGGGLAGGEESYRPGVVHRLDRDTTGVLIFAKTAAAHGHLVRQFQGRTVEKFYDAVVVGHPPLLSGSIRTPIGRDPHHRTRMAIRRGGRPAHTEWRLCQKLPDNCSHLSLQIFTGRTHQIRVHLASIGHPVLGDGVYGRPDPTVPRPMLHATALRVVHPATGQPLHLRAPLPDDMRRLIGGGHPTGPLVQIAAVVEEGDQQLANALNDEE
jgi:23S rRNA pseudouridine1911/1915/1917 synthase